MQKYHLNFILYGNGVSVQKIKSSLSEFGDSLCVALCQEAADIGRNFQISIDTEDPVMIFDICSQLGRIKTVKVYQEGR